MPIEGAKVEYAQATHEIMEFDRDYHTATGYSHHYFTSDYAAKKYCKYQSWTGYTYYVKRIDRRLDGKPE